MEKKLKQGIVVTPGNPSPAILYIYIHKFSVAIACKQALWASQSQNERVMYTVTSQVL